jgi:uncharacterized protein YqfA (UPF0365 family)
MPAAAIATLVIVALIVVALAAILLWIIGILASINRTLGGVVGAVRSIGDRTEPIGPVVKDVNDELAAIAVALEGLVPEREVKRPLRAS